MRTVTEFLEKPAALQVLYLDATFRLGISRLAILILPFRWIAPFLGQHMASSDEKVEKHPDKTFIGRAEKGFDFLGYHFQPGSLTPSCQTVKKHAERICRLYEQGASYNRIRQYIRRWSCWLRALLSVYFQPCVDPVKIPLL